MYKTDFFKLEHLAKSAFLLFNSKPFLPLQKYISNLKYENRSKTKEK